MIHPRDWASEHREFNPVNCAEWPCRRKSWRNDRLCPVHESMPDREGDTSSAPASEPGTR